MRDVKPPKAEGLADVLVVVFRVGCLWLVVKDWMSLCCIDDVGRRTMEFRLQVDIN
jgi:hypothetical protein